MKTQVGMAGFTPYRMGRAIAMVAGIALFALSASAHDDHGVAAATPEGGLSWALLKSTAAIEWRDPATERLHLRPEFPEEILARDAQSVKVAGYMMATDEGAAQQTRFILFEFEPDCLFHMAVGPTGFIDVEVDQPVAMTNRPIVVEGRLKLVRMEKGGIFYRIEHGRLSPGEV